MCKVVSLVVVQCEAESALILAQVVAHEIRIFREIDGFQSKPAQPLSSVDRLEAAKEREHIISQPENIYLSDASPYSPYYDTSRFEPIAVHSVFDTVLSIEPCQAVSIKLKCMLPTPPDSPQQPYSPHFVLMHALQNQLCCRALLRPGNSSWLAEFTALTRPCQKQKRSPSGSYKLSKVLENSSVGKVARWHKENDRRMNK